MSDILEMLKAWLEASTHYRGTFRDESVRIETERTIGGHITRQEAYVAWMRAHFARAACDANPIARAATDAQIKGVRA